MNDTPVTDELQSCLVNAEELQGELDLSVFQLKTLNDVSKELFGSIDTESIVKNFLLMTMGNFGMTSGLVLLVSRDAGKQDHFVSVGFEKSHANTLRENCRKCIHHGRPHRETDGQSAWKCRHVHSHGVAYTFPFLVEDAFQGILGLGPRLLGSTLEDGEKELLETLINNLVVALKNAHSFERILSLNRRLGEQNSLLEKTLADLKSAVRKVELLESVKDSLSKFVPRTVSRLIERSPDGHLPESAVQDLSILFLDIDGYTRLCEQFDGKAVNDIVERHFSVFIDAIHANSGDVNETAGDGLMVLFLNRDERQNALDAVGTAATIQREAERIGREMYSLSRPLEIHMGIHSGSALVGATKFDSLTGSRWTYTARGSTVNLASRIGSLAKGSDILISGETAGRVACCHALEPMGFFKLKNVSQKIEVFKLLPKS